MKNRYTHILEKSINSDKSITRWYDNPDLSDLMVAIFSLSEEFKGETVCTMLHKSGTGTCVDLEAEGDYNTGKIKNFKATFLQSTKKPLKGKIVYHPICTVHPGEAQETLGPILDAIEKGDSGLPKLILIPILVSYNHVVILAIEPSLKKGQTKVSYFDPLKNFAPSYQKDILAYMRQRYGINVQRNETKYQNDGDSCGPAVIEFALHAARACVAGKSVYEEFTAKNNHLCGHTTFACEGTGRERAEIERIRQDHASYMSGLLNNYSLLLFQDFCIGDVVNSCCYGSKVTLLHNGVMASEHEHRGNKCIERGVHIYDGIDVFEVQPKVWEKLKAYKSVVESTKATKRSEDTKGETNKAQGVAPGFFTNCLHTSLVGGIGAIVICGAASVASHYYSNTALQLLVEHKGIICLAATGAAFFYQLAENIGPARYSRVA